MSRLPLSPVIFIVITVILFTAEYFFQTSKQSAVIFGNSLRTLEKLRSQKAELVTWCRAIFWWALYFACSRHFGRKRNTCTSKWVVALRDNANIYLVRQYPS